MKSFSSCKAASLAALVFGLAILAACGDDDSFSPVAKNRGYDYAYTSAKGLSETPCNEMREGREAVIGREKDRYECIFDERDSVYLWAGESDTLTAKGGEFVRAESSSSEESSDRESSSSLRSSSSSYSGSRYSSSSFKSDQSSYGFESKEDLFNPDIDYGTMTDPRDGKVYRTVVVNGLTWLAENLNFYDTTDYPLLKEKSRCYDDDEKNCELLGRLYARDAAMNDSRCSFGGWCELDSEPVQGICPEGWHIPTKTEIDGLISFVGEDNARDIMSAKGWNGNVSPGRDLYGLSFAGEGDLSGTSFGARGEYGHTWVYIASSAQYYLVVQGAENTLLLHDFSDRVVYVATRCIKDNGIVPSSSSVKSSSSVSSSSVSSSSVSSSSVSSSSAKSSSSSVISSASKENFFNPDVAYGTLKDSRDGQVYKTVEINGITWMAENLNFAGNSDWPLPKSYSYCYGGLAANCELYGRLYDRAAAMNSTTCGYGKLCSLYDGLNRGVCPDGWHIPSEEEVDDLMDFTLGNRKTLRSVDGWVDREVGANESGFSLVGSGVRADKNYVNQGRFAALWYYSTGVVQNYLVFSGVEDKMYLTENSKETVYISVRCVKGAGAEPASSGSTKSSSSGNSSSVESSSSEESSSSFDKAVLFNSAISYGEMMDSRDGQTYRTLYIAGHTWMAENLNFADSSKLPILEGNNRCYDDDPGECEAFGRLYSREAALNDSRCTCYNGTCPSMSGNVQGVCPSGWHIPSKSEAEQLANLNANQASSLNSSYGWATDRRGNNSTGMSFVGAGVYRRQSGYVGFQGKGKYFNLWVYDASSPNEKWYLMDIGKGASGNGTIAVMDEAGYDPFYTVRCIKN